MADDHEHFSPETREDGSIYTDELYLLRDPASQRTIQAIHDLYRVDTADRQSVQRAWKQLTQRSQETVSDQVFTPHMELPEAEGIAKRSDGMYKRALRRRWTLLAACLTAFLLLGSVVSLLVILPQGGSPQGTQVGTTTLIQQRTQTPAQLGRYVGNVALGETIADIYALYKPLPPQKGTFPMLNLPYLKYQKIGLQIAYSSNNRVVQIAVWSPFRGMTAEHFGAGMSFDQLRHVYPHFTPIKTRDLVLYQKSFSFLFQQISSGVSVSDGHGTILQVCFNTNQVATLLILQSQ